MRDSCATFKTIWTGTEIRFTIQSLQTNRKKRHEFSIPRGTSTECFDWPKVVYNPKF